VTRRIIAASVALAVIIGCAQAQAPAVPHLTILHSFGNSGDGAYPGYGALVTHQGALYGTTAGGGTNKYYDTVFKLTP
jgi:hypothetical protein